MTELPAFSYRVPPLDAPPILRSAAGRTPVEIIAPDSHCAELLLRDALPLFPAAEIVPGPGWIVRLLPPAGGEWVIEMLTLVESWLESIPLPCAKVCYGDTSYLIRGPTESGFGTFRNAIR